MFMLNKLFESESESESNTSQGIIVKLRILVHRGNTVNLF